MSVFTLIAIMGCIANCICFNNPFSLLLIPFLWNVMNKFDELTDRIWFLEEKLKEDNKDGL